MTDPSTIDEPGENAPGEEGPAGGLGYHAAMAELETILHELEEGEVDIDRLADQVRRAAELVRHCRGRLADARTEVTRIVAELDRGGTADAEADGEDEVTGETAAGNESGSR